MAAQIAGSLFTHGMTRSFGYNAAVILFADLVATSGRVAAVPARLTKVREVAAFLKSLPPAEIAIAVHYLSGDIPQGRIGIGFAALRSAATQPAAGSGTLSIAAVDEALTDIAGIRGSGADAKRAERLRHLFSRASAQEGSGRLLVLPARGRPFRK